MGNLFHKNVPTNLECLEHLQKFDEISYFSRLPSTIFFFQGVITPAFVELYLGQNDV